MYRMIMDFDRDEMRIPKDVAVALDMPVDFGWFVHRGDRQMAITRYMDSDYLHGKRRSASRRKSRLPGYWRDDAGAYCVTVVRTMMQMIGNLITGFDGSGVYELTGDAGDASGEPVVLFDLGRAAQAQSGKTERK